MLGAFEKCLRGLLKILNYNVFNRLTIYNYKFIFSETDYNNGKMVYLKFEVCLIKLTKTIQFMYLTQLFWMNRTFTTKYKNVEVNYSFYEAVDLNAVILKTQIHWRLANKWIIYISTWFIKWNIQLEKGLKIILINR